MLEVIFFVPLYILSPFHTYCVLGIVLGLVMGDKQL